MTKKEREHLQRVAEIGCIVCLQQGLESPAEIHHLRTGAGIAQRSKDVIPLCPIHHRNGGYGIAIHAGQKEWEQNFGTELDLLELTQAAMRS